MNVFHDFDVSIKARELSNTLHQVTVHNLIQKCLQPQWITPYLICIILHILRKPNSNYCFIMHQSIPAAPSAPLGKPPGISIFFALNGKFRDWGLLSCQIPQGGDEKRGQMPRPPSTLQHFSLIAQSNSAVLSILMCDFLFQLTSSFVTAL